MCTTTIEIPAVEPEVKKPDANLLQQLAIISRTRIYAEALTAFLADHHQALVGHQWRVWTPGGEIVITGGFGISAAAERIAKLFPGEWNCRVESASPSYLDWTALRAGGITIRIQFAEKILPPTAFPHLVTF